MNPGGPESLPPPLPGMPVPGAPMPPKDSVGRGVLIALAFLAGAIVLSVPLLFTCWGLIQWIGLIPYCLSRKRAGYPLTVKGALITGFIALLLNGGCDALFFSGLGNMR